MPTARARTFLVASFVLYLFANQTQVGWLYVMSALLAGVVLAAGTINRGNLRGIEAARIVGSGTGADVHEGDELAVSLTIRKSGRGAAWQVCLTEHCPLASPDSAQRAVDIFIPSVAPGDALAYEYTVLVDRRGLHEFPPLRLRSRAPFGFFERRRELALPSPVLVYPEVQPIRHLTLLDRHLLPQATRDRAGVGSEALGVRPYRHGDSPRHIHWRSVARTGQLITREFADETQPGLTLALDLFRHPYPEADGKHMPFEWAVKAAASIAGYARSRGYPVYLLADDHALAAPRGAISWRALMQYLARVEPTGQRPLADVLHRQATQALVAAILPWPDASAADALRGLRYRGADVLVVVLDPASFPAGGPMATPLANALASDGVDVRLVQYSEPLGPQLEDARAERAAR